MLDAIAGFFALLALDHLLATDFTRISARTLLPQSIALELVAILALFVWLRRRRSAPPSLLIWGLSSGVFALGLLRLVSYAVPAYFGRPFSAASDLALAPVLFHLMREAVSPAAFALAAAAMLATAMAFFLALRWTIGQAWRIAAGPRYAPIVALTALAAAGWTLAVVDPQVEWTPRPFEANAAELFYDQAGQVLRADALRRDYQQAIRLRVSARSRQIDAGKLKGRPVLLVFIESYGAITLTEPSFRERLAKTREAFARRIEGAGYHAYSEVIASPVIGGGSWLAHATLASGIRIDDQLHYDALVQSRAPTLADYLAKAGYVTVAAMPRMEKPWPEGRTFGFARVYTEPTFEYAGPHYSWHSIPDQFVLDAIHRRELAPATGPRFVQYVLASSHAAFDLIPPVIDDWDRLGDGSSFRELGVDAHPLPRGGIFENDAGYLAAIDYDLRVLADYLATRLAEPGLIILLGDHQPPLNKALAAGERSVPIHVLSRDPDLLEPFRGAGWTPGLMPARSVAGEGMESFLDRFLQAYGAAAGSAAVRPPAILR